MSQKMTINRALVTLKNMTVDMGCRVIDLAQGAKNTTYANSKINEFEPKAKAELQSQLDSIDTFTKIKAAIAASNAISKVTIAGVVMTVAEAIATKNSKIPQLETLKMSLQRQLRDTEQKMEQFNNQAESAAQNMVNQALGNGNKSNPEDVAKLRDEYLKNFSWKLVDPVGIRAKIEELDKKITSFKQEVDFILSEHNAKTEIEF